MRLRVPTQMTEAGNFLSDIFFRSFAITFTMLGIVAERTTAVPPASRADYQNLVAFGAVRLFDVLNTHLFFLKSQIEQSWRMGLLCTRDDG